MQAVLVGVAVDDELDEFGAEVERVEQDCALRCGPVGGDAIALGAQTFEQLADLGSDAADPARETLVVGEARDPVTGLRLEMGAGGGFTPFFRLELDRKSVV